ncbi:MAG: 50S ribosomal protein L25 [Phycisphaerales bacterium]|nr:50S ribosomal protein L25 [Phycisphaerales bacterium]MCB9856836.1 50S ribosomal protein L25 [Phycisphaerales bacterium]MCB9862037.1 50S ribosomal protein L25 [Phycisphaerales bacterium]
MEIPTITVESRKAAGSRAAARLRKDGKLPAILYGHERDPATLALNYKEVEQLIFGGVHVVNLTMAGKSQACQFKDAQWDHLGKHLIHVDMLRVDLNERVKVTVHLDYRGTPAGAAEGGVLHHAMNEIEIECVVSGIPEAIRLDVSGMKLDDVLHIKDVPLPEGITHVMDADAVVASLKLPVEAPEVGAEAAEGETAEPEVIAKGKEKTEESEG